VDFYVLVIGPQKLETPPKWMKQTKLKSIFFICTKFAPKWVDYRWLLRPWFLSSIAFHSTDPHMEVYPYNSEQQAPLEFVVVNVKILGFIFFTVGDKILKF